MSEKTGTNAAAAAAAAAPAAATRPMQHQLAAAAAGAATPPPSPPRPDYHNNNNNNSRLAYSRLGAGDPTVAAAAAAAAAAIACATASTPVGGGGGDGGANSVAALLAQMSLHLAAAAAAQQDRRSSSTTTRPAGTEDPVVPFGPLVPAAAAVPAPPPPPLPAHHHHHNPTTTTPTATAAAAVPPPPPPQPQPQPKTPAPSSSVEAKAQPPPARTTPTRRGGGGGDAVKTEKDEDALAAAAAADAAADPAELRRALSAVRAECAELRRDRDEHRDALAQLEGSRQRLEHLRKENVLLRELAAAATDDKKKGERQDRSEKACKFAHSILRYTGVLGKSVDLDFSEALNYAAKEVTPLEKLSEWGRLAFVGDMFGLYGLDEAESSMRGVRALASCFQGDEDALTTCKLSIKFVFDYLVTKKRSVLSLGSGNGTFEMAICSMRGETWDPTAGNIRVSERYRVNLPGWHVLDAEELDGTVFRTVGLDEDSSILFNCPWTDWHNERKSIRVVLQNFMLSAYRVLERGRFVFLGITELTEPPYFPQYNLAELAKFAKPGFRLRYIDTGFHDLAWSRGYHHHSVGQDIDGLLSGTLVMLCFERI